MTTSLGPTVSAVGVVSGDEYLVLNRFPNEGSYAMVTGHVVAPGGTTGNIVIGLARLGSQVLLSAMVGDDAWGKSLKKSLDAEGVDISGVPTGNSQTDLSIVLVAGQSRERTILWAQGATISRGDKLDIDRLFRADLTVIDTPNYELCRFLTDLPAHSYPRARLLGTLSYLANVVADDKMEVATRFDILVGNEREYCELTDKEDPESGFRTIIERMTGNNLRIAVMTRGGCGAVAATSTERVDVAALPVEVIDTTGAGDAFVAGLSYALALRWQLRPALRLANAVASFAISALGSQSALPSLAAALSRAELDMEGARVTPD